MTRKTTNKSAKRRRAPSSKTTYVVLFTVESWREFKRHGGDVMGFTERKAAMAAKLRVGDRLLCYLSKVSAFVGILEVAGSSFHDSSPIWSDGLFPVRLPVRIATELSLAAAVPIRSLAGKLSFLRQGDRSAGWTIHVRSSPRRWSREDSGEVIRAIARKSKIQVGVLSTVSSQRSASEPLSRVPLRKISAAVRVGRVVKRTEAIARPGQRETLGSYESVLSFNKVTGYSVNVPIATTCRPTAVCVKTCYFACGAPAWTNALRHQVRVEATIRADPAAFAERVALEYDRLGLSFLRWNGGGDLFPESVDAINHLAAMRPDILLWVVTRLPDLAVNIEHRPNVFIHFSLDKHSLRRREDFLGRSPKSGNFFFSYQCDHGEQPTPESLAGVSVLFFDNYRPTGSLAPFAPEVVCPLNTLGEIQGACESCRRCFDGSAVSHSKQNLLFNRGADSLE
jgi:hypothetical protein